jgi:hypothetical protein
LGGFARNFELFGQTAGIGKTAPYDLIVEPEKAFDLMLASPGFEREPNPIRWTATFSAAGYRINP